MSVSIIISIVIVAVGVWIGNYYSNLTYAYKSVVGSKVVITGASMGIGAELAKEYASLGAAEIVIASRSVDKLEKIKNEINALNLNTTVHVIRADLSTKSASEELIQESLKIMGSIDFLILNHITNSRYGTWLVDNRNSAEGHSFLEEMFAVNTFSYIWSATAVIDSMRKNARGGAIGVVSSLAGHVGVPKTTVYSSTKHALHGFFNALKAELKYLNIDNIGLTLCAIGATDTEGAAVAKSQITSFVQWDSARDAARAIILGVAGRHREIFHPFLQLFPTTVLYQFVPNAIEYLLVNVLK